MQVSEARFLPIVKYEHSDLVHTCPEMTVKVLSLNYARPSFAELAHIACLLEQHGMLLITDVATGDVGVGALNLGQMMSKVLEKDA